MPEHDFRVELISWTEVTRLIDRLATQIRASDFKPDIIVAIARGGYVPARLLCDQLDIYNLTAIRVTHYLAGAHKTEQAQLVEPLHTDIGQANVLLVDDVDDSGDTLQLAQQHLQNHRPGKLKTAVLHHKPVSSLLPDYFARKIVTWRWITYPWALLEDVTDFLSRLEPPVSSPEEAAKRLQAQFQLTPPQKVLTAAFNRTAGSLQCQPPQNP